MIVRELITRLGFNVQDAGLKKAEASVMSLKNGVVALVATLTAGAISRMFQNAADSAEELIKASERTGIAVESLQRLAYSAYLSDISLETLQQRMGFLARSFSAARDGSDEVRAAFTKLGVNVSDDSFQDMEKLLLAVSDGTVKLGTAMERTAVLSKVFGRGAQEQIPWLLKGAEAIRKQGEEAEALGAVLGIDALRAGDQFNDGLKRMTVFFRGLRDMLGAKFFPHFNKLIDGFIEFVKINQEILKSGLENFFIEILDILSAIYLVMKRLIIPAIKLVIQFIDDFVAGLEILGIKTNKVQLAFIALFATLAWFKTAAALVMATAYVVSLLVDDLMVWAEGGDSQFGLFLDSINKIIPALKTMWEYIKKIFGIKSDFDVPEAKKFGFSEEQANNIVLNKGLNTVRMPFSEAARPNDIKQTMSFAINVNVDGSQGTGGQSVVDSIRDSLSILLDEANDKAYKDAQSAVVR